MKIRAYQKRVAAFDKSETSIATALFAMGKYSVELTDLSQKIRTEDISTEEGLGRYQANVSEFVAKLTHSTIALTTIFNVLKLDMDDLLGDFLNHCEQQESTAN